MRREVLSIEAALDKAASSAFPWAMIHTYSNVALGKNPIIEQGRELEEREICPEILLEARFFSESEEIRIFRQERELRAIWIAEGEEDLFLEETVKIANQSKFGDSVTIRRLVDFDDDGQAQIVASRLSGWAAYMKGGEKE